MAEDLGKFKVGFEVDTNAAIAQIQRLQDQIEKWKAAMEKPIAPAAMNSFNLLIQNNQREIDKLSASLETNTAQSYNNFRAIGQMDRITREFASGGLNQGLNGLTMFGNTLTRLAVQEGGFKSAITGLASAFTGPAGIVLAVSAAIGIYESYEKQQAKVREEAEKVVKETSKENTEVSLLIATYGKNNTTLGEKKAIIEKLNSINPTYFGGLDKENTSINQLNNAYTTYLSNLQNVIIAKKLEIELSQKIEDRLKFEKEAGINLLKTGYRNPEYIGQQNAALTKYNSMLKEEADLAKKIAEINPSNVKSNDNISDDEYSKITKQFEKQLREAEALKGTIAFNEKKYTDDLIRIYEDYIKRLEGLGTKQSMAKKAIVQPIFEDLFGKNAISTIAERAKKGELSQRLEDVNEPKEKNTLEGTYTPLNALTGEFGTAQSEKSFKVGKESMDSWFEDLHKKSLQGQKDAKDFANVISRTVTSDLNTLWNAMQKGESITDALGEMFAKLTEQLVSMVIQATIFAAIMESLGYGGGKLSFGDIFGQFLGLPTSKNAEGGITTGPQFGLIGEAGPEAILPLSKLGNIVNNSFNAGAMNGNNSSSSNGEFVLKGSDLVLALNRANFSLNVRR